MNDPHRTTGAASAETTAAVLAALWETTKPGITRLVSITAGVGFILAALTHAWDPVHLVLASVGCILGTAMSAAGANALNQWFEHDRDALMPRTHARPIPSGRLTPGIVLWAALALSAMGVATLWVTVGPIPAAVSLATILLYVLVYTPMKPLTVLSTLVGAIPGALPPVIGWTAAAGGSSVESILHPAPWTLFLIMFIWQIPHFLAIAWMYRDDYAKGGYRMLPLLDPSGAVTVWTIFAWALLLLPATLAPVLTIPAAVGLPYLLLATAMGTAFLVLTLRLTLARDRAHARVVFFASIIHLPLLFFALVGEALLRSLLT